MDNDLELYKHRENVLAMRKFNSPIIHCEIYLPAERASFGIISSSFAKWTFHRTLQREWITLEHDVSDQQYENLKILLNDYVGRKFDTWGFWLGLFCNTDIFVDPASTFCSRIVAETYTHPAVGLLPAAEFDEYADTIPPKIYAYLEPRSRTHQPVATRLDKMARVGVLF
jgi:hypothetical protein